MNKLRSIFNPTEEEKQDRLNRLKKIEEQFIKDKECIVCRYTYTEPHIEMGYDGGVDRYCMFTHQLVSSCTGELCEHWEVTDDLLKTD